ncbi:hypothetical protein CBF29_05755 [Vagococcus elongatus]|uniref:Cardiolipin synthase N-terminal domain-containing protein n=1 Tax=Vagococcus elongatus TaxID=180344 RepID=A0A430AXE8_9ENTE|nr:hypothetical protein CBF29_05755 [Vagococcus elongatus]
MSEVKELLPLILPIILIHVTLVILSVKHILKHPRVRIGNKWLWLFIVILIQIIGPVLYFTIGREEE